MALPYAIEYKAFSLFSITDIDTIKLSLFYPYQVEQKPAGCCM